MGGIRPGKAKGPWVGDTGGGDAPSNAQYVVMALDATLTAERVLTQGTGGISIVDSGAGAAVTINNTLTGANVGTGDGNVFRDKTAGPDVINLKTLKDGTGINVVDGANEITINNTLPENTSVANVGTGDGDVYRDMTGDQINLKTIKAGSGITVTDNADDITVAAASGLDIEGNVPAFHDDFLYAKPFWDDTQAIQSGDWSLDIPNEYLQGDAENNSKDWIRRGIEGDFDYQFKIDRGSSTSCGFQLDGNGINLRMVKSGVSGKITVAVTGESGADYTTADDELWLRATWDATGELNCYYKLNDGDAWTLLANYSDIDFGHDKELSLDSANGGYILRVILWDNMAFHMERGVAPKTSELTDAATVAVDASKANFFHVTLAGNRTLGAPTNPVADGQQIIFRIEQDGTGNRTLGFNAIYRFSTDLPSPTISTGAGDIDYLGFIYHESDNKWDFIAEIKGF